MKVRNNGKKKAKGIKKKERQRGSTRILWALTRCLSTCHRRPSLFNRFVVIDGHVTELIVKFELLNLTVKITVA